MTSESHGEEIAEAPAARKPKLTRVVVLSILLGVLLAFSIAGGIYHVRSGKALRTELAASKDELKHKTQQLAEQQEQISGLSRQMHALREFSLARANAVAAAAASSEPPVAPPASSPPAVAAPETTKPKPASAPLAKQVAPPPSQDCRLIGKSPEEQSATLKRCMQSMDGKASRR